MLFMILVIVLLVLNLMLLLHINAKLPNLKAKLPKNRDYGQEALERDMQKRKLDHHE